MREKYDINLSDGIKGARPKNFAKIKKNRGLSWFYLGVAGEIGYTIAIPLVLGVLLGSYFKYALVGLGIGFIISVFGFIRIIKKLL